MTLRSAGVRLSLMTGVLFSLNVNGDVIDTSSQEPWERCAYCHGIDGIGNSPRFPHLAGQSQDYLRKQLRDFRDGRRTNDDGIMATQAADLKREEIRVLARYFSQQTPPVPAKAEASEEGKRLYEKGDPDQSLPACIACHGHGGHGVPKLDGQRAEYLEKQLDDFAADRRSNAPAGTMDAIARKLTEQQRHQLAAYIASLGGGSH